MLSPNFSFAEIQSIAPQFLLFREKPRFVRLLARRRRQNDFSALFFVTAEKHTHESVTLPPFGKNFALLNFFRYSQPALWLSIAFLLFTIVQEFLTGHQVPVGMNLKLRVKK